MAHTELTNQIYLSQIYFRDDKLRRFALREFDRCLRTGRMTAFVGSMATEGLGYPDWPNLLALGGDAVKKVLMKRLAGSNSEQWERRFRQDVWGWLEKELQSNPSYDGRIVGSVIGHWIDNETGSHTAGAEVNYELGKLLVGTDSPQGTAVAACAKVERERAILDSLAQNLQIRRFITTNYDMELEYALAEICGGTVNARFSALEAINREFEMSANDPGVCQRIVLPNGLVIASDAFARDRLDRLIEFSLGSTEIDYHVMHLHGRIDKPATMIVSYRDYDRLYRRAGVSKAPFDQALTMLHSSNPVVFVGLGMNEVELNAALQEIVGNQPFKGVGRRFLLWSPPQDRAATEKTPAVAAEDVRRAFRLEKLHKLGVLTIFEDEVGELRSFEGEQGGGSPPPDKRAERRRRLAAMIGGLARRSDDRRDARRKAICLRGWREPDFRGDRNTDPVLFTWHFARRLGLADVIGTNGKTFDLRPETLGRLHVRTSRPGTSKGTTATTTALRWAYRLDETDGQVRGVPRPGRHVYFANMSLRLDTDSVLESLYAFLRAHSDPAHCNSSSRRERKCSREREFRSNRGAIFRAAPGKSPLVIFKGLERIFNKSGIPLSAEMDQFFRSYVEALIAAHRESEGGSLAQVCRVLVFGTRRMRLYFRRLQQQVRAEIAASAPSLASDALDKATSMLIEVERFDDEPSGYLRRLRAFYGITDEYDETSSHLSVAPAVLAGDRSYARETYRLVFSSKKFIAQFPTAAMRELAFAVMTVMAFVGQPVEAEVLFHAPRVRKALENHDNDLAASPSARLQDILVRLSGEAISPVRRIARPDLEPSPYNKVSQPFSERYALHMTLQAEFRERYGVPLSEATLSTSFNMSLYTAQPADAAISEPRVHDELGKLIDWFIGAYRDSDVYDPGGTVQLPSCPDPDSNEVIKQYRRARPFAAAALRAALAILRGFYSTSALLSLDLGERAVDEARDGALTEHADRIERLIRAFEKQAEARVAEGARFADELAFGNEHGPGAMYRDELVWLHNERGVVKLAQGDLYEARFSLDEADRVNREEVEFDCRSHNWRRIWLNQIIVDLERGKLVEAEDRIGRIENSLENPENAQIIRRWLQSDDLDPGVRLPLSVSHEDCLAVALATGYRAIAMYLRGEIHSADATFERSITMLEHLDEQRACAFLRRYHAMLLFTVNRTKQAGEIAHLAICGAESVQQMDIAYRARIARMREYLESPKADERRTAMTTLTKAIAFACEADIHRIAVEANSDLAMLKLHGGDLESALEHASIAMALAARYGLSLEKIRLRIVFGQILFERGASPSATALIRNAINQADRVGFQRAVEEAQLALLKFSNT